MVAALVGLIVGLLVTFTGLVGFGLAVVGRVFTTVGFSEAGLGFVLDTGFCVSTVDSTGGAVVDLTLAGFNVVVLLQNFGVVIFTKLVVWISLTEFPCTLWNVDSFVGGPFVDVVDDAIFSVILASAVS